MRFTQIDIHKIDTADKRFQISPFYSIGPLIPSLKETGLLNPPVITKRENRYIIVSGWKRLAACQKLSISLIPVFVMQEQSDREIFKIPIFENLSIRDYTQIEKAVVIRKLYDFGESPENIIKKYMTLLKVPPHYDVMDAYMKIDKLNKKIKEIAHEKKWSFGTLELITEFTENEIQALYPFLKELSLNKQKQLVENIFEISKKRDVSVKNLLSSREYLKIQNQENLSSVQKAEKIHLLLRKKRNPTLSAWRESLVKLNDSLDLPEEMTIMPSKFFEEDMISIKLDLKNRDELKKNIDKLKELSKKEEISLLFDPLSYD